MEKRQESWSTVPVSEKMAQEMAAPAAPSDRAARLMQQKIMKLAEKAFKRQQQATKEATGKPFTAEQWKKKKNRSKIAKKSRKNNR